MAAETVEILSRSPEETVDLGRRVGAQLGAGQVVLLRGDLGTGKTTFVKGLAEACAVTATVRSPTFALLCRYRGRPDLVHIDLYREQRAPRLGDLDWESMGDALVAVEWPPDQAIADRVWPDAYRLELEHVDQRTRRIRLPAALRGVDASR
ncbi:MAG: tRNA (adenosine(37)-N6)-threonylcarbamoyltransferase complex ATPase subunit type 1 TsaE [Planctomycetota bacterium]|nr:tRNA (adenosine(37)-N6)-threonylcarbamoyltransferase complex ATPase subunit type 1 TsaE [Planctomycetota bacterium]